MLNKLFLFLFLLGYSHAQYDPSFAIASSWSMWSPWSFCSNNVMIRVRACSTFRGFKCIGHNKEFQSCNSGQKPTQPNDATDYDHEDHQDREQAMKQLYQDYEPALPDHPHTAPRYRQPAPTRPAPVQPQIQQYSAPGTRNLPVARPGSNSGLFTIKPTTPTETITTTVASTSTIAFATPGLRKYKAQYVTKTPTTTTLITISEESSEFSRESQEYDEAPTLIVPVKPESGVVQAPIVPRYRPATEVAPQIPKPNRSQAQSPDPQRTAPVNAGHPEPTAKFHRSEITVMGERQDVASVLSRAKTVASQGRMEKPKVVLVERTEAPLATTMTTVTTPSTTVTQSREEESESSEEQEEVMTTRRPIPTLDEARQRYLPHNPQTFPIATEKVTETTTEATTTTTTTMSTTTEPPMPVTEAVPVSFQPQSRHAKIFEIKRPFVRDNGGIPANFFAAKGTSPLRRAHTGEFSVVQQHLSPLKPIRARLPEATNEQEKKKLLEETASLEQKIKELEKKMELKKRKKTKEIVTTEDDVLIGDTARALSWMLANMTSQMEMGNMPIVDMIPLDRVQKKKLTPEQRDLKRRLMKENKDLRVVQAGVITHPLPNGVEITPDFPVAEAAHGIVKVEPKKKHTGKKRKITWSNWSMWSDCRCGTHIRKRICMPKRKSDGTATSCPPAQHEISDCKSEDNCSL